MTTEAVEIVERRTQEIVRFGGRQEWVVSVFGGDGRVMLVCHSSAGTTFQAHFDAGQWAEFQQLIGGER